MPLVTLTMVGALDARRMGTKALIMRTTLTTLVP